MTSAPLGKPVFTYFFLYKIDDKSSIVKIGRSETPKIRKRQIERRFNIELETICVLPFLYEKELHILLDREWLGNDFKMGQEWFLYSNKIMKIIEIFNKSL